MNKILLDTSAIVDFLRRRDREQTLLYSLSNKNLCVPIIVHTELYSGRSIWESVKAREALEKVLAGLTILAHDIEVSKAAGKIKARNHNISLADCIIAATAFVHNLELATLNTKDFAPIKELKFYKP